MIYSEQSHINIFHISDGVRRRCPEGCIPGAQW